MKQNQKHLINSSALVLAATTALFSSHAADATNAPPPLAAPAPAGVGTTVAGLKAPLLNNFLRKQSDLFNPWDLGGQVRARFESKNYFGAPGVPGAIDFRLNGGEPSNDYWLFREKVHLGYTQPWFGFFLEARDSSSSGDDRNPNPEVDQIDLHQGYLTVGNPKEFPLSLKAGRQQMVYGDERLIGTSDWTNLERTFDAVKLRWEGRLGWVDAFVSQPVLIDNHSFNQGNEYEMFSGLYASSSTLIPRQQSQIYFLARNAQAESPWAHEKDSPQSGGASERNVYTMGIRFKSLPGQFNGWDYGAEIMGQLGTFTELAPNEAVAKTAEPLRQEAYAAFVGAGYTWTNVLFKPRLGFDFSYGSGDRDPNDDTHGTFDNLFPTNHKFYGMMDFFSLQNVINPMLIATIAPCKGLTLSLSGNMFWLATTSDSFYNVAGARRGPRAPTAGTGYGINPNYGSYVGSEIDFYGTYQFNGWAVVQAGYGHFFNGTYVEQSLSNESFGATAANYGYVQMTFNF